MKIKSRPWVARGFVVALAADIDSLERENEQLKRAVTEQTWRNLERIDLKRALDSIAHYVAENPELAFDYPVLGRALESAGYDVGAPGEPEPFIHGDSAEGAEG